MHKTVTSLALLIMTVMLGGASCISFGGSTAAGPLGMFVSVDKGETWQQASTYPTAEGVKALDDVDVYRLVPDPEDPSALYWLSRRHGLFYSYNDGKIWQKPDSSPFASGFVYSLAVHPADKCIIYATNGTYVYKTEDCSRSWQEVYRESRSDTRVATLAFNPFAPYDLFMAQTGGDLLVSQDEGRSWTVVRRFDVTLSHMALDPLQENAIYVASRRDGLYRSLDGGVNWEGLAESFDDYSDALEYRRLLLHPQKAGTLYWVSTYGILVSADQGTTWKQIDLITPPGSAQIYGFAVNPQNDNEIYYTATINSRSTFYKSEDGGVNWITKKMPSNQLPTLLYVHPEKSDYVYLGFTEPPKQ